MGLADFQRALARLYTDASARSEFLTEPSAAGARLGLAADETRLIERLRPEEVAAFARSLQRKRLNEIGRLLPLSRRVLGADFDRLFLQYADTHRPVGTRRSLRDALAFARRLERGEDSTCPLWMAEAVVYEAAWLETFNSGFYFRIRRFRHAVHELARRTGQEGVARSQPARQSVIAAWLRLPGCRRLWHAAWP